MKSRTRPLAKIATLFTAAIALSLTPATFGETLTIKANQPGTKYDPLFYGIMTEEINYCYDGGLYAELIQNRIFRNPPFDSVAAGRGGRGGRGRGGATQPALVPVGVAPNPIPHWTTVTKGNAKASIATDTTDPINTHALTTSLKLTIESVGAGERAGVANDGFWGIPVKPNTTYKASFYAKTQGVTGPLNVAIESTDGTTTYASAQVTGVTGTWKKYEVELKTGANVTPSSGFQNLPAPPGAAAGRGGGIPGSGRVTTHFTISASTPGTVWFNLVSLFPPTYKNRANGMRPDLMQLLADMKNSFLRFPGGNYLEGYGYENRFIWKNTIGPLEDRPGHQGTWGVGGHYYRSSDGVGLLEFLHWCEDLNIEPVLGVYAGLSLGGSAILTGDQLKPVVTEALEEIEYVIGGPETTWGARRIEDGHPAPFKLTYVEIGNEDNLSQGGPSYNERFSTLHRAIKAKYPQLKTIASARNLVQDVVPDVEDSHHYMNATSAIPTSRLFDPGGRGRRPNQPKIFIGEYATRIGSPTPTWTAALYDAVFLTGMERNTDLIMMTGYAPLFTNVNPGYPQFPNIPNSPTYPSGMQWSTDLIGYDTLNSFGSTSYHVIKLFANNRGDVMIPVELQENPDVFASASTEDATGDIIVKLVSGRGRATPIDINLEGANVQPNAQGWIMTGGLDDQNSIAEPTKIAPKPLSITNAGAKFTYSLPPDSVVVLRLKTR